MLNTLEHGPLRSQTDGNLTPWPDKYEARYYFDMKRDAADLSTVVHSDPQILGGTPVFIGTRVPVKSLFDYLEGGATLDEFLRQFPSVKREQAIAAIDLARDTLLPDAPSS